MGWGIDKYYPVRINVKRPKNGYYLRWYYNGWHYWFFLPGQVNITTAGEKYRTLTTREVGMGSGQVTEGQIKGIRTIMNTREVALLTDDGWMAIRIKPGSLVTLGNQVSGYLLEIMAIVGSREDYYSPVETVPFVVPPLYSPDTIIITTIIDGIFTIVITGTAGGEITIDWGDGSAPEDFTLTGGADIINHDYTGSGGVETTIEITGDLDVITDLDLSGNDIIDIILAETLTELESLDLSDNELDHLDIPPTLTELDILDISDNNFTDLPIIPDTVPVTIILSDGNPLSICELNIGTQVWMCSNYDSNYPNSKVYLDDSYYLELYGRLYSHSMVHTPGFCPTNYHLPTKDDWEKLASFIGSLSDAGGKLKSILSDYWLPPNTGAVDSYDFDARGGGYFFDKYGLWSVSGSYAIFGMIAGPDVAMTPANITWSGGSQFQVTNGDADVKVGHFIVPATGTYKFHAQCIFQSGHADIKLFKNSVSQGSMTYSASGIFEITSNYDMTISLISGDDINFSTNPYLFNLWTLSIKSITDTIDDIRFQGIRKIGGYWMRRISEIGVDSLKKYYAKMLYDSEALTIQYYDCVDERIGEDDEWRSVRLIRDQGVPYPVPEDDGSGAVVIDIEQDAFFTESKMVNIHTLRFAKGNIYAFPRNPDITTGLAYYLKYNAYDYTKMETGVLRYGSETDPQKLYYFEQICKVGDYLYAACYANIINANVLIQWDTRDDTYKMFRLSDTYGSCYALSITADATHLYIPFNASSGDPDYFSNVTIVKYLAADFQASSWPKFNTSAYDHLGVPITPVGTLAINPDDYYAIHALRVDDTHIYCSCPYNWFPSGPGKLIKIDKDTMTLIGTADIPNCSDDMGMTDTHVFLGAETGTGDWGDTWATVAIRKSDLNVTSLIKHSTEAANINSYGTEILVIDGVKYLFNMRKNNTIYIIRLDNVDTWSPAGSSDSEIIRILSFSYSDSGSRNIPNELVQDPSGVIHTVLYGSSSDLFKFKVAPL